MAINVSKRKNIIIPRNKMQLVKKVKTYLFFLFM